MEGDRQTMNTKVRALYANGVFMPLDPPDLTEREVADLTISEARRRDLDSAIRETKGVLDLIYQLSNSYPKKYKLLLNTEDDLIYLERERRLRDRLG